MLLKKYSTIIYAQIVKSSAQIEVDTAIFVIDVSIDLIIIVLG